MIPQKNTKVAFVVAHDAYLKGALNVCKLLEQQSDLDVSWLTTSKRLAGTGLRWIDINQVDLDNGLLQADVVFAGLGGRDLNRLIRCMKGSASSLKRKSPLIVSYFPGVLHLHIFESLMTRLRSDRVLLNCERDYKLYRRIAMATIGHDNGMLLGAPWIVLEPEPRLPDDIDLLFVEQSIVPESLAERTKLVEHLVKLSLHQPEWRVVVALRARKDQASSHQVEYCLEEIANRLKGHNHRLEFSYDNVDLLVSRSKRVATISSSVAFTSIAWQKPTLFVNDLGVSETWGNDLFKNSGYMGSLHEPNDYSATHNSWYLDFIQTSRPEVVAALLNIPASSDVKVIPKVRSSNLPLIWLMFWFCVENLKKPWVEIPRVLRTVRNINKHTYSTKGSFHAREQ